MQNALTTTKNNSIIILCTGTRAVYSVIFTRIVCAHITPCKAVHTMRMHIPRNAIVHRPTSSQQQLYCYLYRIACVGTAFSHWNVISPFVLFFRIVFVVLSQFWYWRAASSLFSFELQMKRYRCFHRRRSQSLTHTHTHCPVSETIGTANKTKTLVDGDDVVADDKIKVNDVSMVVRTNCVRL